MNLVALAHPHRRALYVLLGFLVVAGARALFTLPQSIYPRVAFPRIAVIAARGEAPVRDVLASVTKPLEIAVATVPDLMRVRSKTLRGASEINLDFRAGTDMREALSLVRSRAAQAGLPSNVTLTIEQQTPAVFPVISFNVMPGPRDAKDPIARARLAEWAETEVKPRIARLPDTFMVTVQSGDRREYDFEVDPVAMAQAGVGILQVKEAIAAANVVSAVGRSSSEGLQYQVLVDGLITDPSQILDVGVPRDEAPPVRLGDLGSIVEAAADRTMIVTGGGRDGVVVSVFLRDGGKVTRLSADIGRLIDESRRLVPGGGTIETVYDQAVLVSDSMDGVRDAIELGAFLSVAIMFLFLGSVRLTFVAGLAIPISVVVTFALFPLVGESLNLMSLGGIVVAIGLIIDNAIVVVENVARRAQGLPAGSGRPEVFGAVSSATGEVVGAIVGSSFTTVVVFFPLVLLEGVVGQFFRSLSLALGVSILVSMVVSLVYSPLMMLLPGLTPRSGAKPRRWMEWMQRRYAAAASWAISRPLVVTVGLVAVLLAGVPALRGVQTGFLPEMDEGGFVLDYALPVGSSLEETDAVCRRIESVLLTTPEVASLSRRTGAELGFFATEQFTGDMLVGLKPRANRSRSVLQVMDDLRERLARRTPQAEVEFIQVMQDTIADLAGNPRPIEVKILGGEYRALQRTADAVEKALDAVPGIVDVKNRVSFGSPELSWRPDPLRAARLGLNTETIAAEVTAQMLGEVATRIPEGDRFVDLRVRYAQPWRADAATLGSEEGPSVFVHPAQAGTRKPLVPLSAIGDFRRVVGENELERENQGPMVRVTASVSGRDLGSASRAVEAAVRRLPRRPGVRVEFGGQVESQKTAFSTLLTVFGLGAGLVFLLLVVQFRSLRLPVVMFLALPFGQLGGLLALYLCGVALNISSGMGLIMLVGLVVKNGIIMIEYAQRLHRDGLAERDAIVEAARVRLRPVLMTTLAAIAGLVPLAMGVGAGAELQRPLAIAVIGGLVVSTVFTLIVVPFGCAVLARGHLVTDERHVA